MKEYPKPKIGMLGCSVICIVTISRKMTQRVRLDFTESL